MWVRTIGVAFLLVMAGCKTSLDLSERLDAGETRAGQTTEDTAFFGGISAEGEVGDFKIYNSEVAYIIQGLRPGAYLSTFAGGVIDADVVRKPGALGRDIIDDWAPMFGFGRYMKTETVEVLSEGREGPAIVRATGGEGPIEYLAGAMGLPHNDLGLRFQTDYILYPDTPLLEVVSTIFGGPTDVTLRPGDAIQAAKEVADVWEPGVGLDGPTQGIPRDWAGFVGRDNQVTVGVFSGESPISGPGGMDILGRLMLLAGGFAPEVSVPAGGAVTYRRHYGVGRDGASLTEAWMALRGDPGQVVEGTVTAPDGPVSGARAHVFLDGAPWTIAVSDATGAFSTVVPSDRVASVVATGRGTGYFIDGALGGASYGPYATLSDRELVFDAWRERSVPEGAARSRGVGTVASPLTLSEPGRVTVKIADGGAAEIRFVAHAEEDLADPRLVLPRPSEARVMGWARLGQVTLDVPAGEYSLVVHRGLRFEPVQREISVVSGEHVEVEVSLEAAYAHPEWLLTDPHIHASPSSDGLIPMEERLVNCAGVGLQLHFGTDHDHIADYGPLLAPLGLSDDMATVVADEVSPFARGHINLYPLETVPGAPNGGAWIWWNDLQPTTQDQFDLLRDRHGDVVIQVNHAFELGLVGAADWRPGRIRKPDFWSDDFQAFEFMNGGGYTEYQALYFDLVNRGVLSTPMGTSDAHGYAGRLGLSATFMHFGLDDPAVYTPELLKEVVNRGATIVTRGPFLEMSIVPGSLVVGETPLTVRSKSPSFIVVDRLELLKNGEVVETVEGTEATFSLQAEADAVFTVMAHGDTPMQPVWSQTPFAMSAPIYWDKEGDGWEPNLPPLVLD